jgi:hypothetical protein
MPETKTTHLDYAGEAEAAERAEAWPQAAALWRRGAECFPKHPCARAVADRDQYLANAAACDRPTEVDAALEKIATGVLHIPTLRHRRSDRLDFHELGVGQIRLALRAAYEAGRQAAREG